MPAAAHSPATAACGQRPPSPVIALAPLGRSHLDGRHPPHHSCNLPSRASSARQPAAPPCDPARLSNPHRPGARRTVLPSLPAVSSLGGFRTPAASARGKACERPASENLHRNELMHCSKQASYSITSSASSCMLFGTTSPSALAVFILRISSNLVGCRTGRSPGFAPRRMRPAYMPACRYKSVMRGP